MLVMCLLRHAKRSYRPWWIYWPRRHCWAHCVDEGLIEEVFRNGITGWLYSCCIIYWKFTGSLLQVLTSGSYGLNRKSGWHVWNTDHSASIWEIAACWAHGAGKRSGCLAMVPLSCYTCVALGEGTGCSGFGELGRGSRWSKEKGGGRSTSHQDWSWRQSESKRCLKSFLMVEWWSRDLVQVNNSTDEEVGCSRSGGWEGTCSWMACCELVFCC